MIEFVWGIRAPPSTTVMPASARIASNRGGVLSVPVPDGVLHPASGVVEVDDEVPGGLGHRCRGRVGGGAEDADPTGGVFDHGQDV
jgi:hypothetical protein